MSTQKMNSPRLPKHFEAKQSKVNQQSQLPLIPSSSNLPENITNDQPLKQVKSEHRFARESTASQDKRVRLRDYLFTARSSLEKNKELQKQMRSKIKNEEQLKNNESTLKQSIQVLKKNKYHISNQEMHKIVKSEVENELKQIISNLRDDLSYIEGQDLDQVTRDDMVYFYQIRKIVLQKIKPTINEMREASLRRQKTLIQQMFSIGDKLAHPSPKTPTDNTIGNTELKQSTNIDVVCHQPLPKKHQDLTESKPIDLVESLFFSKTK